MRCLVAAIVASLVAGDAHAAATFPVRMVKLVAPPGSGEARAHLEFSRSLGFNAVFVYAPAAGAWPASEAPAGPRLHPEFLELARFCRDNGLRLFVSVNPVADTGGTFRFTDRSGVRRIRKFVALLRRQAGVKDIILSFDDQPPRLTDLSDILRFGLAAAPAHLDLVRRVASAIPPDGSLWFCGAIYNDAQLGDGASAYARGFLRDLPSLPPRVGIVWTGTRVFSPSITRDDLAATAARLGGRSILLYDNYPVNDDDRGDALALILGPLRERDARLHEVAAAYLACPMSDLGASRLPLRTIADWLRDPSGYDPEASIRRAMDRTAGDAPAARRALDTQVLEWGGFIDTPNWLPRAATNPERAAAEIDDPGRSERLTWTAERYPARMAALTGLADEPFRDSLLRAMNRRLAVARMLPLAREYLARKRAGRPDAAEALAAVEDERARAAYVPEARRAADLFLRAAEVP